MTAYGSILRRLLDFTGSKLYAVADEVGYDVSYISKWCNKDLLPAPKTAHAVNGELGRYFAAGICRDGQEADFAAAFPEAGGERSLDQQITALLARSYEASAQHRTAAAPAGGGSELLIQHHEILGKLRDLQVPLTEGKGEVVCTIDLLTLLNGRDFGVLDHLFEEGEVHLHAALDMDRFQQDTDRNLGLLYQFISRHRESYVTLYEGSGLEREGFLAIRGGCAMMMGISRREELDALWTAEGASGAALFEKAKGRLRERPVLLSPATPEDMRRNGYRTDFYSRDQFRFFSPYGFEFLLPQSARDRLLQTAPPEAAGDLRNLFITWEEVFQKSHIEFWLLKSSALRYLESGELLFADILWKMSPKERLEHLDSVKERVLNNQDIRFVLLDDEALPSEHLPSLSAYVTPKKLFLKNPSAYLTGRGPKFYSVHGEGLIRAAGDFLGNWEKRPDCRIYDYRDVEEVESRYGGMMRRMLSVDET